MIAGLSAIWILQWKSWAEYKI